MPLQSFSRRFYFLPSNLWSPNEFSRGLVGLPPFGLPAWSSIKRLYYSATGTHGSRHVTCAALRNVPFIPVYLLAPASCFLWDPVKDGVRVCPTNQHGSFLPC